MLSQIGSGIEIGVGIGVGFFIFQMLSYVSKQIFKSKIQYSTKHDYDQRMLILEEQKEIRLKAEIVSELLAEWTNPDIDYTKINKLCIEAYIWLPEELARDLADTLAHVDGSKTQRMLTIELRKHIRRDNDDGLTNGDLTLFKNKKSLTSNS